MRKKKKNPLQHLRNPSDLLRALLQHLSLEDWLAQAFVFLWEQVFDKLADPFQLHLFMENVQKEAIRVEWLKSRREDTSAGTVTSEQLLVAIGEKIRA